MGSHPLGNSLMALVYYSSIIPKVCGIHPEPEPSSLNPSDVQHCLVYTGGMYEVRGLEVFRLCVASWTLSGGSSKDT